ncbi:N-acetylmuramoyl-L-alanine amidase CwlD [Heyndrickxia sporothermodurans]|uniref:Germination-specific N-acetylmuramoyl-L-alanine amidase, cell wall hydrolase CwlD n=1 Tax=Heyndrickxia sporothermodurans TaxID=46224 RepID=A0A150LG99_9BACI|nr:N-acetylmuramoyl-L-alanine amidase CwlD [Heyndrickxia sporothermodurans]KYD11059.1 Germination-specific N-acetylmuramoyl-L-alanine amidase, cell wall hydrolase CwlD [Heyndrickxia sporothermodurans]MBL5766493.1 N-acetylmuramoyl-L-alanine amidase CwlD [Heyndrickxia sporothermodurans]MBL5769996.1 N-acetylmuramoyl-L-alanine amidase CwlD [Heyndrickxia sporothermodurans]MBL5773673.1 N-acetylmuramoyl-L-alanine amidase CwlD [Heyndrickxia sporothermodurans]MBL5777274.1 N-acetylmuramoyl-L-alanine ami
MSRKVKLISFILGALLLFLLFQFQFFQKDTWDSWNLPLSGKVIILDPGHGGPDGGAGDSDALEKEIALKVSLFIRDYLQEQGALVLMTREDDSDLADPNTKGIGRRKVEDLKNRLNMINESDADLYLSIHLNAIPSPRWSGAQTFYSPHLIENKRLAKFIQSELIRNLENTDREAKILKNIYVVKNANKPGALVEIGFLSNPTERQNLMSEKYQKKVSASIYNGIMRYFTNEKDLK